MEWKWRVAPVCDATVPASPEATTDAALAVLEMGAVMKTGATNQQIEEALTRRDGSVGYRCRCPHCQELAQEWAETFVPPTHRIIALDDLKRLRTVFAWSVAEHGITEEDQPLLTRINAIIEGDEAEQ